MSGSIFASEISEEFLYEHVHKPASPQSRNLGIDDYSGVSSYTGSLDYSYSIEVPDGTNGLQPKITLFYNSQRSGRPTVLGTGWMLGQSYVQRDVNSTWNDTLDDSFKLVLDGITHDLVFVPSENRYHTEIESFTYIENLSQGNNSLGEYWIAKTKDGAAYRFGFNNDSEAVSNQDGSYVSRWSIDLVNDTYGNSIFYFYKENPFPEDSWAVYLDKIEYNNDRTRVIEFLFDSAQRPDLWNVYEDGSNVKESRLLKEILVKADNDMVRKYVFDYETRVLNFLSNITSYGGDNVSSLPPVRFEYKILEGNWTEDASWAPPVCFDRRDNFGTGTRLVDVNGDGLVDIVTRAQSLNQQGEGDCISSGNAYINNGSTWVEDNSWAPPVCIDAGWAHYSLGIRFVDVNNDGLVDILQGLENTAPVFGCSASGKKAWINNGTGWAEDNSWAPPVCFDGYMNFSLGTRLEDVNNDGLIDILVGLTDNYEQCNTVDRTAYIHNGSTWVQDDSWEPPVCFDRRNNQGSGNRLADVNGDGLVDILYGVEAGNCNLASGTAYINNGSTWVEDSTWAPPTCFDGGADSFGIGTRLIDLNNDGLVDVLRGQEDGSGNCPTRLAWINNGTGWAEDNSWAPLFCFDGWVDFGLGKRLTDANGDGLVDVIQGFAETGGSCQSKTAWISNGYYTSFKANLLQNITNEYGGVVYVDYKASTSLDNTGDDELSDLGFNLWVVSSVLENNSMPDGLNVMVNKTYDYANGSYDYSKKEFRGFGYAEENLSDSKTIRHWFHQDDALKGREYKTETYDNENNVYQKSEYSWSYDSVNGYYITKLVEEDAYAYDGISTYPKIVNTTYSYDDYGNVIVKSSLGDANSAGDEKYEYYDYLNNTDLWIVDKLKNYYVLGSNNVTKLREAWYRYDDLEYGEAPIRGGLTFKEDWLDTDANPAVNMSYDSYGNLIKEVDANNHTTEYVYGLRDATYTFRDRAVNDKEHITDYVYDFGTGNVLSITDSNGFLTNYTYDVFGRKLKEILPYDSVDYPTREYVYDFDGVAPEKVKVMQREEAGVNKTLDSWQFFDGFNKLIQTKTEFNSTDQVTQDVYYDSLYRVEEQTINYLSNFSDNYSSPDSAAGKVRFYYDALDRVVNVTNPDGTNKSTVFNPWNITFYDENEHRKDTFFDAYGRIINVVEFEGGGSFNTTYDYDTLGNLLRITDAVGNTLNYTYDSLGKKTALEDPDLGGLNYSYDLVGNLIQQVDNNGTVILMGYDSLNRITSRNGSIGDTVTNTYDININRTLYSVVYPESSAIYSYDQRLRKVSDENIMRGVSFVTNYSYDSLDRLTFTLLSDGGNESLSYNEQGLVNRSEEILDDINYNVQNKPVLRTYANNLDSAFEYDSLSLRLTRILTSDIQDLKYAYDFVGNVLGINNSVDLTNYVMEYDKLDRLIFTERRNNSQNPTSNIVFSQNFSYNSIGNMLSMIYDSSNYSFAYNGTPVHAPSSLTITDNSPTKLFTMQDTNGNAVASFTSTGDITLKGTCSKQASCAAQPNSFNIYNSNGEVVAYLDTDGDLCIETGDCSDNSASCSAPANAFYFADTNGNTVIYIDQTGDLCLTGSLTQNGNP